MRIYKVERKVDTVILEMDIDVAEKLAEALSLVNDETRGSASYIDSLREMMVAQADVRSPSPLYVARAYPDGVLLSNATSEEMVRIQRARRAARDCE